MVEHERRGELRDDLTICSRDLLSELCYILNLKRSGPKYELEKRIIMSDYDFEYIHLRMNYLGFGVGLIDYYTKSELSAIINEYNLDKQNNKWNQMVEIIKYEVLKPSEFLGSLSTEILIDYYEKQFETEIPLSREDIIIEIIESFELDSLEENRNLGFIMMAMSNDKTLEKTYQIIKDEAGKHNINAIRIDEIESSNKITDEILKKIKSSKYLFVDLTYEKPNVYYELGYSHGSMKNPKRIVLLARKGTTLHFDIRNMRTIFYSNSRDLRQKLKKRLEDIVD